MVKAVGVAGRLTTVVALSWAAAEPIESHKAIGNAKEARRLCGLSLTPLR